MQRQQSPQRWKEQHTLLAEAFRQRRCQLEEDVPPADGWWEDERWRSYRLQETYHRLCADHRTALPHALRELLDAQDHDITTLRRWAQTMKRAGQDTAAPAVRKWGQEILDTLEGPRPAITTLTLFLSRGGLDASGRCLAYIIRSWEHRRQNNYEQALIDCNAALDLEPTAARAYRCRGETYRLAGRYEEALADFNRAIELDPKVEWAIESRGRTYESMGRYEEALADFGRAIALAPGNSWLFTSRGITYRLAGRYEEALADFDRAIELDPDRVWFLSSRGEAYRLAGRHEEALADFNRAIELDPNYVWAIGSRGQTYQSMSRHEEALADFNRAIELDPGKAWIHNARGATNRNVGRYEEALSDFGRAIELDPDYAWVIARRGYIFRLLGRYEEALADLNRAIELEPESSYAITNRGVIYRVSGQYEKALADFNRAIEIDPTDGWTQYEKTVVLFARQNPECEISAARTIELCSPPPGEEPNSIADTGNLFLLHCLMLQWDEADRYLSAFFSHAPDSGSLAELCTVMETLRPLVSSAGAHLSGFQDRLNARLRQ